MEATDMTALQTMFTDAIGDLKTPALAIMGAGLGITALVVGFRFLKGQFHGATSGR